MIIRVFPRRTSLTPTDEYAFVGDPPMIRPAADEVHISCTFTWDIERSKYLAKSWEQYYPKVYLGGPALSMETKDFIPGIYVKRGVTFTSRGCKNDCPWCLVRRREGILRENPDFAAGNILQDNNITQCDKVHQRKVFAMLRTQKNVELSGGIESCNVDDEFAGEVRSLRLHQLFLACDYPEAIKPLRKAIKELLLPKDKVRCYVLFAFNGQTLDQAESLCREVWEAGAMPFAQLYQPPDQYIEYSLEWKHLARTWSRPAAMKAHINNTVKE